MEANHAKKPTFQCANFNLKKAARVLSKIYEAHLATVGLKGTQFSLLMALHSQKQLTISQIAKFLVTDRTSVSRALRPLEKAGLVKVSPCEKDRRIRRVFLTEKGKTLAEEAIPLWKEAQTKFLHRFGQEEWEALYDLLQKVADLGQPNQLPKSPGPPG